MGILVVDAMKQGFAQVAVGRKDAVMRDPGRKIWAIASGPAAPGGGKHAAQVVLNTFEEHIDAIWNNAQQMAQGRIKMKRFKAVFRGLFALANDNVRAAYGGSNPADSSATVLIAVRGGALVSHVGKTRAYVIHQGKVVRATHDTIADERNHMEETRLAVKAFDPEMAKQRLGQQAPVEVEGVAFKLVPGSVIALVSEGVAQMVRGNEILGIKKQSRSVEEMADSVVRLAQQRQIYADAAVVLLGVTQTAG